MKAMVYTVYGSPDVLQLKELEKPAPENDEVLIRVRATTVTYGDLVARDMAHISPAEFHMPFLFWLMARLAFGLRRPKQKILGGEFSGEVEAVGEGVTRFGPGDPVFGYRGAEMGAYAQYLCMPEDGILAEKPSGMSYEEAAVIPYGSVIALNLLDKVDIQSGDRVLINGASGSLGSAAVQLAKSYGAEVTGVCGTPRRQFVRSLGAEKVIDYTQEDFTQGGETYDVIFDILGKSSFARCRSSLKEDGRYLLASFKTKQLLQMLWTSIAGGKRVVCTLTLEKPEDLVHIKGLIEEGKIKAVIDRSFPLREAAQAHRYVESGRKKGHVVITVGQEVNS